MLVIKVLNFGIIEVFVIYNCIMNQFQIKMRSMKYQKKILKLILKMKRRKLYFKVEKFIAMLMKNVRINSIKLIRRMKKINSFSQKWSKNY